MGTQRLSSIETKRFIFEPLSAFLKARDVSLANRTVINDIAVIAILGTRSIGKTTLLKQLYDTAPDVSEYLDLSVSIRDSKFEEYFAACKAGGKTRILLDEVCKIDKEYEADFVKAVKDYVPHMTFVITGSTQAVVSALSSKICRGIAVELVPIMYAESLAWSLGSSVVNPESEVSNSTISLFEEYLRKGGIVTESLAVQPLSFSEKQLDLQFKNLVLCRLNACYSYIDKYRTPNQLGEIGSPGDELDALYTVRSLSSSRVCGVESKWRPRESISNIRIAGYVKLANRLGLDELALTSTTVNAEEFTTGKLDVPTKIYRCDLLVLGLEAEYMRLVKRNLSGRECMGSSRSVLEIMEELLG